MSRASQLQELLGALFERGIAIARPRDERSTLALCEALLSERGEVSGHLIASAILLRYEGLDAAGRIAFFRLLAERFDIDAQALTNAASRYREQRGASEYARLLACAEPGRQELMRRLNRAPGATARLVRMRADLLSLLADNADFARVDLDFEHLFASWFNRGFLVMRRIDWSAPASLLEKIIDYEAVHKIDDWDELRRRIQPDDRRCFAFFHPAMPDEPLIFVEVALTVEVPGSIGALLASDREPIAPDDANTAVFYSISNCQAGLRGVSFGNFLIKQVAGDLAASLPQLRHFVTLSPVPGLMRWIRNTGSLPGGPAIEQAAALARAIADGPAPAANDSDPATREALRALAASYLVEAKRDDGQALDPVARFHLGNGASLDQIHFLADGSAKGRREAAGIMVNYRYDLKKVEENHERYAQQRRISVSRAVRALLPRATRAGTDRQEGTIG